MNNTPYDNKIVFDSIENIILHFSDEDVMLDHIKSCKVQFSNNILSIHISAVLFSRTIHKKFLNSSQVYGITILTKAFELESYENTFTETFRYDWENGKIVMLDFTIDIEGNMDFVISGEISK